MPPAFALHGSPPVGRHHPTDTLPSIAGSDRIVRQTESAWTSLKPTLERVIGQIQAKSVLEIGAGRHPFFSMEEAQRLGFRLTINDIDAAELDYAPRGFDHLVLDVAQDVDRRLLDGHAFDLIFSRMVFEHVKDARKAWTNLHDLLAPGGVGFAFVPTLYSPPFVLNRLLPDDLTGRALRLMDRTRNDKEIPKFPAYYDACRASETRLRPFLKEIGFSEALVVPFYGTPYFPRIPVLRQVFRAFDMLCTRHDLRTFASYAYIIARK
ncbi:hypothetical protein MET9862_03557 [Methylobacterium symbioticum]|uniref:Ubiquinone biosynthesis O-methyltransferase n=1 Tax=Methylobacterium symbioticum TaxID=2584084 RepID=A0A509EFK3_9HYPH|nr:hypothetical protein MET9862_03557 [Methylobacterium symbioticum]